MERASTEKLLKPQAAASLSRNFSWMFVGNAVYAACQWAVLSLFARLSTSDQLGQFVLALAITAPILAFFLLQMRVVQATDARRDYEFGHYLGLRILAMAGAFAVTWFVCLGLRLESSTTLIVLVVALSACADGLSDAAYGLLQQREQLEHIARSLMIRGVLSVTAIGIGLYLTGQPVIALSAGVFVRLLILAGFDLPNVKGVMCAEQQSWHPRWDWSRLFSLAKLALPLGMVMMLLVLNNNIPRYYVEEHLDPSALGIFGAISYLAVAGQMVVGALGESVASRLARAFAQRDTAGFLRLYLRLSGLGAAIGVAGIIVAAVAGYPILWVMYGPEFAAESGLLVWIMSAAAVGYVASFSGYAITAARYFRSQIPLFAVVAAANACASSWLVPRLGLQGAALALLIATVVQLLGTLLILGHALMKNSQVVQPQVAAFQPVPETV
ncbi:MAG: hypothetical protein U0872_00365 [Planctomycetaceae bacterium]